MPDKIVDGKFISERSVRQVIIRSIKRLGSYERAAQDGMAENEQMELPEERVTEILDEEWKKHHATQEKAE